MADVKKSVEISAEDARILARVKEADVVILIGDKGQRGVCAIDGRSVPMKWDLDFGEDDDPPLTIRRVKLTAGHTQAEWRKMDRSALQEESER